MSSGPFQPLRADGRSRAEVIFDLAVVAAPGAVLTYKDLAKALELDPPVDLGIVRRAAYDANRRLRRESHRSLEAVRGEGYRVLHAREHASQARRHQQKARRQVTRSLEVVKATDVRELTEAERRVHDSLEVLTAALVGAMRYVDGRFRRQESAIEQLQEDAERTSERLAIIEAGLRAAGVRVPGREVVLYDQDRDA